MNNFNFLKDVKKMELLKNANNLLGLDDIENRLKHNNIIFIYSVPKVGSTSLSSSLLLFASDNYSIIHIHDEIMLKTIYCIEGVTIPEIINYNAYIKRNIYVFDIYRDPIEHKISSFFEKIELYHFNTDAERINNMDITMIYKRFNNIFPYLSNGDIFTDVYSIDTITKFDFEKKYILYLQNLPINGETNEETTKIKSIIPNSTLYLTPIQTNYRINNLAIKYIKLRLKDVNIWNKILLDVLGINCKIMNDYATNNKDISFAFMKFKETYKIPINLLRIICNCKYFNYYYSPEERMEYLNKWRENIDYYITIPYSLVEYNVYLNISNENQLKNYIDNKHYIYDGCICKGCKEKKRKLIFNIMNNKPIFKIIHTEANRDLAINKLNLIKHAIQYNKLKILETLKKSKLPPKHIRGLSII